MPFHPISIGLPPPFWSPSASGPVPQFYVLRVDVTRSCCSWLIFPVTAFKTLGLRGETGLCEASASASLLATSATLVTYCVNLSPSLSSALSLSLTLSLSLDSMPCFEEFIVSSHHFPFAWPGMAPKLDFLRSYAIPSFTTCWARRWDPKLGTVLFTADSPLDQVCCEHEFSKRQTKVLKQLRCCGSPTMNEGGHVEEHSIHSVLSSSCPLTLHM